MSEQEQNTQQEEAQPKLNTGLICLEIAAKINNVNIDLRSVVREFGIENADIEPDELVRVAKNAGFKIKKKNILIKDIEPKYPIPAIIQMKEDNSYAVILGVRDDKALILAPPERHPKAVEIKELQEQINPEILVLKHKLMDDEIKFGFK